MDKQYYYIDPQGVRQGPLPLSSIPREHLTPTTKVWCKGMDTWEDAYKVPDFAPLLAQPIPTAAPQPPAPYAPQPQGYQAQQQGYQAPISRSNGSKKALFISLGVIGGLLLLILIGVGCFFLFTKKIHHNTSYATADSVAVDSTAVDSTADYEEVIDTTDYAAQEDYGYDDNNEEEVTLVGYMTDETGDNPIRITFRRMGDNIYDCVYTNVALGGKIRMQGSVSGDNYIFSGKDGRNDFIIDVVDGGTSVYGSARDGSKHLEVTLKYD